MKKVSKQCIIISLFTGFTASSILLICDDFIITKFLHDKVSSSLLHLIALALPCIAMTAAINGYFTAMRKVYKTALTQFFEQIIKIVSTVYLIGIFLPRGLEYACFCLILGDVISEISSFTLSYTLYLYDIYHLPKTNKYTKSFVTNILSISVPVAVTSYIRSRSINI